MKFKRKPVTEVTESRVKGISIPAFDDFPLTATIYRTKAEEAPLVNTESAMAGMAARIRSMIISPRRILG